MTSWCACCDAADADSCDDDPDDTEVGVDASDAVVPGGEDDELASDEPTVDLDAVCRSHRLPSHILHLKRLNVDATRASSVGDGRGFIGVHSISTVLRGSQFGPFDCWIVEEPKARRRRQRQPGQIVEDSDDETALDWMLQVFELEVRHHRFAKDRNWRSCAA